MHTTRIITALLLVGAFIPTLFLSSNMVWASLMLVLSLVSLYEWAGMAQFSKSYTLCYLVVATLFGGVGLYAMQQSHFSILTQISQPLYILAALFWLLLAPIWLAKRFVIKQAMVMALLGMILLAPLWIATVAVRMESPWLLLLLLVPIWIADSAAYFTGKKFGKHKLAPNISPGKTWEGVAGAMFAVTLFAVICCAMGLGDYKLVLVMWMIVILGVIGDLFESMMKRHANIKDSGSFLPGHGGILDRIDGVIPSLPIALILIAQFNVQLHL